MGAGDGGERLVTGAGDPALDQRLSDELDAFNRVAAGAGEQRELTVKIEDAEGHLIAGLSGWTWGTSAGIGMLWVREDHRRGGCGSRVLAAAEQVARDRGCERINVSSFTFQAPGFYERHGYEEAGRTEALPLPGRADVHFVKQLEPVPSTRGQQARSPGPPVPHSRSEDVAAVLIGALLASFGLYLLASGGAVTGGTPGLGLLLTEVTPLPFALAYAAVNVPFVVLAVLRRGWRFTLRSATAVALLAGFSFLHPLALPLDDVEPVHAVLLGNLLAGVGLIVLFRHGSSLGGFAVVALECQDRLGWRAGYVQLACDAVVLLLSVFVIAPVILLLSVAGAVVLNSVLAVNHRPGRYLGV